MQTKKAVSAGFQEAVCEVLVKKTVRAAKENGLRTIVVGGGVSANTRLREKFGHAAGKESLKVLFPKAALCQDNAAMIAGLGAALVRAGKSGPPDMAAYSDFSKREDGCPRERT